MECGGGECGGNREFVGKQKGKEEFYGILVLDEKLPYTVFLNVKDLF